MLCMNVVKKLFRVDCINVVAPFLRSLYLPYWFQFINLLESHDSDQI